MKEKYDGLVDQLLSGNVSLQEAIEVLERSMIQRAMEQTNGNQCAASKRLKIHRNTLLRKIREYDLVAHPARKPVKRVRPKARKGKTSAA
jgi:two-component system response regulator AtoC